MHAEFAAWQQAMLDLEAASRADVAPKLRADAVRRAAETHAAILRAAILQIARIGRAVERAADATTSAIDEGDQLLHTRLDAQLARLHTLEQIVLALQASFAMLQASMGDLTEEPDDDG